MTRNCQKERIGEVEIRIRDVCGEVVADAERKAEAVESLSREFSQICLPEGTIIEPRLVFDVAVEWASDAADFVGGSLNDSINRFEIFQRVLRKASGIL